MGVNWAATLLGLTGLMLTFGLCLFFKFGSRIRSRSEFAPCFVSYSLKGEYFRLFTVVQDLRMAKTFEDHQINIEG
jgi:hypothetical protein